jgi:hypothetical protein
MYYRKWQILTWRKIFDKQMMTTLSSGHRLHVGNWLTRRRLRYEEGRLDVWQQAIIQDDSGGHKKLGH